MEPLAAALSVFVSLLGDVAGTLPSNECPMQRLPEVHYRHQLKKDGASHLWRTLPRVVIPAAPDTAASVNADLETALGGDGFTDVVQIAANEALEPGDATTRCTATMTTAPLLAFACETTSIGAHPYETTIAPAYDLRERIPKRVVPRSMFTDQGAAFLGYLVAFRAQSELAKRGVSEAIAPRLDPLSLHGDRLVVTFDRCSLGPCIYGGTTVTVSCAEATVWLRPDSPWRCN